MREAWSWNVLFAFYDQEPSGELAFSKIVMKRSRNVDEQERCLDWVNSCDGKHVFPRLPRYLRSHCKSWKRNQAARNQAASANFEDGAERLKKLNQDSANALAQTKVRAPLRMGNDMIEAAAPFDGVDVSATGGGGKAIAAGTSVSAAVHPKAPKRI